MMHARRALAFTLIEVTAVLVLVALMATAASLSLRSAYRGAQMQDIINRVQSLDQSARRLAEITGQAGVVRIDRSLGRMVYCRGDQSPCGLQPVQLPAGYSITDIRLGTQTLWGPDAEVPYTGYGRSPTYALSLAGTDGPPQILVFAGLTGQLTVVEHDEDFDLDNLLTPRPDTH